LVQAVWNTQTLLSGHHAQFLIFNLEVCTLTTRIQNLTVVINCTVQTLP